MKRYPIASVLWEDSHLLAAEWMTPKGVLRQRRRTRVLSVGLVIADDERGIVLAQNKTSRQVSGITVIPRGCIIEKRIR